MRAPGEFVENQTADPSLTTPELTNVREPVRSE
jgi:hypothetical protein